MRPEQTTAAAVDSTGVSSRQLLIVLAISGAIGFILGSMAEPSYQVCVETAQVLAGVVEYPWLTPACIYHKSLWTVLHQLCAAALQVGVSETTLSIIVGGLCAMVSFQGIALVTLALSRRSWLAILAPGLVALYGGAALSSIYPVLLYGTEHTYGTMGRGCAVVIVGLLGLGRYRAAALLLGALPAIHPSWGAFMWVITALALATMPSMIKPAIRDAWRAFALGAAVAYNVLRMVYGIDIGKPDRRSFRRGVVPRNFELELWHNRSLEQWQELRHTLSITSVLAFANHKLQLPEIARDDNLVLYEIPGPVPLGQPPIPAKQPRQ